MWPAFWLLPVTGRWPGAGEVDIFEGLGDPSTIYCTVIYGNAKMSQAKVAIPFDVGADFHRYGLAWSAKELVWYVDRREVARRATPPSIDRIPMYMLLNLAVGGAWGGQPNALTEFPGRFVIRRVTAWQLPGE
jgi:beta-glucanase (GH16 family)